ncbi:MAG: permease-like cell division protein FtsX [Desulfomicrobium escambiense]|nr:permease-like cell division protein FtsX [Desulfomicrobium escambiense]
MNARGTTVVVATHDRVLLESMSRRVIILDQGRITDSDGHDESSLIRAGRSPATASETDVLRKALFILRLAGQDIRGNIGVHLWARPSSSPPLSSPSASSSCSPPTSATSPATGRKNPALRVRPERSRRTGRQQLKKLAARPEIAAVAFTSREQALQEFKLMLGKDSEPLEGLDDNPLPASFT